MNHVESNDTAALRLAREAGWELPPEPPSPGVEAVAEVLHKHFDVRSQPWRDMHEDDRDVYREIASAALDAARAGRLDSTNAEVLAACEELERHVPIENLELPGTVKCSCGAPGAWGLYGHVQHRMHAALIAARDARIGEGS